jgi:hypothetical protein
MRWVLGIVWLSVLALVFTVSLGEQSAYSADASKGRCIRPQAASGLPRSADASRGLYAGLISRVSSEEGVDPELIRAII